MPEFSGAEFPTMTLTEFTSTPALRTPRMLDPATDKSPTLASARPASNVRDRDKGRGEDRHRDKHRHRDKERPAAKKPRAWAAIRRSASSLAAALADRPSTTRPRIATQAEFRRAFLKAHRDRLLRDDEGNCFRLQPVVMNGDCGFASIAKGINLARERVASRNSRRPRLRFRGIWNRARGGDDIKRPLTAKDIRNAMFSEIRKAKKTYLSTRDGFTGVFSDDDFERLERDVGRQGIAGHWLGTVLGVLEHVIVAHALNVNIFLYQFDLQRQCIRQFESATVQKPDCEVFLFFTGPAACGHFDTLVKTTEPRDRVFQA